MRVTFAGARRPAVRAAAATAGACAEADVGLDPPPSAAPTTPPSDFAKALRSTAISPHAIVTAGGPRAVLRRRLHSVARTHPRAIVGVHTQHPQWMAPAYRQRSTTDHQSASYMCA